MTFRSAARRACGWVLAYGVGATVVGGPAPAAATPTYWDRVGPQDEARLRQARYAAELAAGDEFALMATSDAIAPRERRRLFGRAEVSYRNALTIVPADPEASYRLAQLRVHFVLECASLIALRCQAAAFDRATATEVVALWTTFTEGKPLDPRASALLFDRAILLTKLGSDDDFRRAIADYETIVRRASEDLSSTVLSNLGETYMMVGDLDRAIEAYRAALAVNPSASAIHGLAVALDRAEHGGEARDLIRAAGEAGVVAFMASVEDGSTFFVPEGEQHYYFALALDALGDTANALREYRAFVRSGAHPRYQARAQAHIKALTRPGRVGPNKAGAP